MLLNAANAPPEGDRLPLDDGEVVRPLLEVLAVLGLDVHLGEVDGGRACNMIMLSNEPSHCVSRLFKHMLIIVF